jgi:hypothetical protein
MAVVRGGHRTRQRTQDRDGRQPVDSDVIWLVGVGEQTVIAAPLAALSGAGRPIEIITGDGIHVDDP